MCFHRPIIFFVLCLGLSLLVAKVPLHAQVRPPMLVGPVASINIESDNVTLPVFPNSSACGEFTNAWSYGPSLGGRIGYPSLLGERLGISTQILLNALSGRFFTMAAEPFIISDAGENTPREAEHEYRLDVLTMNAKLDIFLEYALTQKLHMYAGPSVGYRFGTTIDQTDYILDEIYRFSGGVREQTMNTRFDLTPQTLILGATIGASYSFALDDHLTFSPELFLRTEFTPLFTGTSQRTTSVGLGVSVLTNLTYAAPPIPTLAALPSEPQPPVPPLRAFIAVESLDDAGNTRPTGLIRIYETFRREDTTKAWHVQQELQPPTLLINPFYASPLGIQSWRVRFLYGNEVIGEATNNNTEALSRVDWHISNNKEDTTIFPLTVELTATDSSGASVQAIDKIPLQVEHVARLVQATQEGLVFSLFPTTHGEEILNEKNTKILTELASTVRHNNSILITGYTLANKEPSRTKITEDDLIHITATLQELLQAQGKGTIKIERRLQTPQVYRHIDITPTKTVRPQVEIMIEPLGRHTAR